MKPLDIWKAAYKAALPFESIEQATASANAHLEQVTGIAIHIDEPSINMMRGSKIYMADSDTAVGRVRKIQQLLKEG